MAGQSLLPPPSSLGRSRFPDARAETSTASSPLPLGLALGALGVVYGDIGTNPLFALGEAFAGHHAVVPTAPAVLGVLSLIFWALLLVISFKYLTFVMRAHLASVMVPLPVFLEDVAALKPPRVPGTAVFMTANTGGVPVLLLHHFKHNHVLHENVVLLTITSEQTPFVKPDARIELEGLGHGFHRLVARFGYMETPNVPDVLAAASRGPDEAATGPRHPLPPFNPMRTTYFLGRETLLVGKRAGMWRWQKRLFAVISRNAKSATSYFGIPPNRVVELGMQIEL